MGKVEAHRREYVIKQLPREKKLALRPPAGAEPGLPSPDR